jgi:GTP 3',8-cyclase
MVSITTKAPTNRSATAVATIVFSNPEAYAALTTATLKKGDALAVARIAGIMAAKKTSDLIPLAHPGIGITGVVVDVDVVAPAPKLASAEKGKPEAGLKATTMGFGGVDIRATVECSGQTGVEMEALSAATVAGLTVYDMCKGVDRGMVMVGVRVVEKRGGRSGWWRWDAVEGKVIKGEN